MTAPGQQPPDILKLYPDGFQPMNPEAVDAFLHDLPRTDPMSVPRELAKKTPEATVQFFEQVGQTTRRIEEDFRRLGWYASVFAALREKHPDALTRHSSDTQARITELISRMALLAPPEENEA